MHLSFQRNLNRDNEWYRPPLDADFFYSVPTSFFVMDERVPRVLRELLTESEGCLKSNFLTGASACARKVVYELAKLVDERQQTLAKSSRRSDL